MGGVRDGDAVAVHGDLAGKRELARCNGRRIGGDVERLLVKRAVGARRGDDALDEWRDRIGGELAGAHADHRAPWIDGDERGPGTHGVCAPHAKLTIVQHGMRRPEPDGRITNPRRVSFGDVFAAMDTYDGDRLGEPLLELPQLRKHMDAVDSAVGPEIEKQQLPTKVGERQCATFRVNPFEARGEIRGSYGRRPIGGDRHEK